MKATDWRTSASVGVDPKRTVENPEWMNFVCDMACHRLALLHHFVVATLEPEVPWRIISTDGHSTVYDGARRIFDPNFEARGIPAVEAWLRAGGAEQIRDTNL
eukprot:SAG31_NODE_1904_length_6952_cov_15.030498_1_plen_103_part_00